MLSIRRRLGFEVDSFRLCDGLLGFGTVVVVSDFDPDLSCVFSPAGQVLPQVALAATKHDDVSQVDPGFSYQFGLLVVIED